MPAGTVGYITQSLGGSFTVFIDGNLFRIAGADADAIGKEPVMPPALPENASDDDVEKLVWSQMKTCYDPEIPVNIVDLGVWWAEQTDGLPLPLGGNVIRRDLGGEKMTRVAALLKESIEYSLANREKALDYALDYGRGLDRDKADRFVGMYVNDLTVDYGDRGRKGMQVFLDRAHTERLIPKVPQLDFL